MGIFLLISAWAQELQLSQPTIPDRTMKIYCDPEALPGGAPEREVMFKSISENFRERWGVRSSFYGTQDPQKPEDGEVDVESVMKRALSYPNVSATMGINSTPAQRAIDPRIPDRYTIGTGLGFGRRGSEHAFTFTESLDLPTGKWTALEIKMPYEISTISEDRRQELGLPSRHSSHLGDIAWALRFHFHEGSDHWYDPDVALRAYTQSASGESTLGRYYDKARYTVEIDLGETLYQAADPSKDLQRVRLVEMGGLDVPQDRDTRQIDRFSYGVASNFYFKNGMRVDTGFAGYLGYADGDTVSSFYGTLYIPLSQRWNVAIDASCGLNSDTPDMIHVTFGFGDVSPFR